MIPRILGIAGVAALLVSAFLLGRASRRGPPMPIYPTYTQPVGITNSRGAELVTFLDAHLGEVVFIHTYLDLSVSMAAQSEMEDRFQMLAFLEDSSRSLPLADDGSTWLQIEFIDGRSPPTSHGGTGIVMVEFVGYFRVTQSARSGPSVVYHLREIPQVVSLTP